MVGRQSPLENYLKICGIVSPYFAVLLGVFYFKNGFLAVLAYHLILLLCIVGINRTKAIKLILTGFHRNIGPLICLGGLLPGVVILFLWPIAKSESIKIDELFETINLTGTSFIVFALYACFVNPFLEESFWRGCFNSKAVMPNIVDVLFAGYHALAVFPVLKPVFVFLIFLTMAFVGWLFRTLYRISCGLAIPLLTHIIADIAILYAVWKIIQ
ncbi:MAG: CPBP family glutamic-type intramembrane protease [Planctomycetota bacterium]|jgi:membrane protease YdiL (CAAX protease family)